MNQSGPFLRRLTIRNYKSIAACRLDLGPLAFLVGPNGSGKSNCLDALRFVAESLRTSIDHALRDRGSISEVRRRSGGHPTHFAIRLDFVLPSQDAGFYAFRVGSKESAGFEIQREELRIWPVGKLAAPCHFKVERGTVTATSEPVMPAASPDRLLLVAASGLPAFRPVYDALSAMEVYNLNPKVVADLQRPDAGERLKRDGSNAASVFQNLLPAARDRVQEYLPRIVPGIVEPVHRTLGHQETLEFRQNVKGQLHPWKFFASSMSDGTLRAFGVLLALFQSLGRPDRASVIGLEEPEMALHPGAVGILMAALREASDSNQIIVTSHSPDLLDDREINSDCLYAVTNDEGTTRIASIEAAGREAMKKRLFTAGELLRMNQLTGEEPTAGGPVEEAAAADEPDFFDALFAEPVT